MKIGLTFPASDGADFTNYHTIAVLSAWIKKNHPGTEVIFSQDPPKLLECDEVWCTANSEATEDVNRLGKYLGYYKKKFVVGGHHATHCPESILYGEVFSGPLFGTINLMPDWSVCGDKAKQYVVMSSYGCPFRCNFCSSSHFWSGHHIKSVSAFADELLAIKDLGAKEVNIFDDLFAINAERLKKIINELHERRILPGLTFGCLTRADGATPEILELLKLMDVKSIAFGAESGSDRVLGLMGKKTTSPQNQKAVDNIVAAKLGGCCSLIIGYPGETEEDLNATIAFIRRNRDKLLIRAYPCIPYPGTKLWKTFVEMHNIDVKNFDWSSLRMEKPDWSKYKMMVSYDKQKLIDVVENVKEI